MLTNEAAIRLTADSLKMIVPHALGIDKKIGCELTKEPAPGGVGKSGVRTELSKLAHHGCLSYER